MHLFLNILIVAGIASGLALLIGILHRKYQHEGSHDSDVCSECMTGFLCSEVLKPKDSVRG
jgi:hypothetical protein